MCRMIKQASMYRDMQSSSHLKNYIFYVGFEIKLNEHDDEI